MVKMKRTIDHPTNQREKIFHRQNPMSCRFCRSKKLKCDRLTPCSNCTSRRISCVSAVEGTVWSQPQREASHSSPTTTTTDSREDDLVQRVKRIEQALFSKTNQDLSVPDSAQEGAPCDCTRVSLSQVQFLDQVATESCEDETLPPGSSRSTGHLESSNRTNNRAKHVAEGLGEYLLFGPSPPLYKPLTVPELVRLLPSATVARKLFSFYVENLNWTQHIIHVPTTQHELDVLYQNLRNSTRPELTQISLVVAVLAVAAYFWPDPSTGTATCPLENPKAHCQKWMILVQRALMEANHLTCPTIESLQAKLLLTQYLPTYPRSTGRPGHLALLISQAHLLQLHRIDSPRRRKTRANTTEDAIRLEIQRRVWWTIVINDWLFSFISWGQLGTYLIHPDHTNVQYPSNVDDNDIVSGNSYDQAFLGPPTEMTFLIAKIRIAKIVRELRDAANKAEMEDDELDYGSIMTFDKKINDAYGALPAYLRYDGIDRPYLHQLFQERPYLERQRRMLLFGLHNTLALLHRRFLARAYKDPRYTYSRIVCLKSTRTVIEMQEAVRQSFLGHTYPVIYHVFVAATTLTMDYVYNRDNPQVAAERKREALKSYRILEECGEQDSEMKQGLESLKRILQERRNRSEPRPPIILDRLSPDDIPSAEAETWSFPDSNGLSSTIQSEQQRALQVGTEATARAQWASAESMISWAPQNMTQTTYANDSTTDRLARTSNLTPRWANPENLPLTTRQISAINLSTSTGPGGGGESSMVEGVWAEPSPDLWLSYLDPNSDVSSEAQWEELFQDLGAQQFMTGF